MAKYTAIDEITENEICYDNSCRVLVSYENGIYVYGYVTSSEFHKECLPVIEGGTGIAANFDRVYSKYYGHEVLTLHKDVKSLVWHLYAKSTGFPYSFDKKYEAIENFNIFDNRQVIRNSLIEFPIEPYLKYTFGIEFETNKGIISERICLEDGLIPLRDGSINGNEYSTVVLEGRIGLNLLKQQLEDLRNFTSFDKECSLHIHLGKFPLDSDKVFKLYKTCFTLQQELAQILPRYTFDTSKYKRSGKDYCNKLKQYSNFGQLFKSIAGMNFYGSFFEPHPADIERKRKWNVHSRYVWLNFVNLFCYEVNKTIEFRFLRPTYNLEKILFWLYVFNGILLYAESSCNASEITLMSILHTVYPKDVCNMLEIEYYKMYWCTQMQHNLNDFIGERTDIEAEFFDADKII